ncbi:hypothetical protein BIY37_11525 [Candidatus Brocadia sapporoensis]|uniref:Uncharacterized protein n=1 Tax=Candidatus Brocadia sapporoensis TaxID=392547 RepID=A0A1V6LXI4_9BACT|nr:hypothetical protein BIY37_11525 [Candidatus Brocadia sapporoensis]TVL95988.1 MAG: hypothetical protein CV082_08615 [Candidatus Brocadia sp. BL1]GJQ23015.1 MAG: hypothetical protein HBSAPP01_08050 [Candidatus Brocadia sapporoensis]
MYLKATGKDAIDPYEQTDKESLDPSKQNTQTEPIYLLVKKPKKLFSDTPGQVSPSSRRRLQTH